MNSGSSVRCASDGHTLKAPQATTHVCVTCATLTASPVPCVISFKFFGDLQNYTFLERLGPTEPEK